MKRSLLVSIALIALVVVGWLLLSGQDDATPCDCEAVEISQSITNWEDSTGDHHVSVRVKLLCGGQPWEGASVRTTFPSPEQTREQLAESTGTTGMQGATRTGRVYLGYDPQSELVTSTVDCEGGTREVQTLIP